MSKQDLFNEVPVELRERPQWVLWKIVTRDGEKTKKPFQLNGAPAKSNDPATWTTFTAASASFNPKRHAGIGYVFSADDDFCGIDLDGCRDPQSGVIADWAKHWIAELDSYCEVSPSGTGVKVFVRGKSPFPKGRKTSVADVPKTSDKEPGVEVYDHARYFATTGHRLAEFSAEVNNRQDKLEALAAHFWPARATVPTDSTGQVAVSMSGDVTERARMYLAQIPPAVSEQGGHNVTFKAACALVQGFGLTPEEAFPLLKEWNVDCKPPWTDQDLMHKLDDAAKQPGPRNHLRDRAPEHRAKSTRSSFGEIDLSDEKGSTADHLVDLALKRFRFGRNSSDEPFAVELDGPNIARPLRGSDSLRTVLARDYRREVGRTPNSSALADALLVLGGEALETEAEDVALRVADYDDGIVIDLGRADGKAVIVNSDGWNIVDRSPILFRRTGLTGAMPLPERGGSLDDLRALLNVNLENWLLLRGFLVASLRPSIPHPILMLGGIQGTGKSTALRLLCGVVDPSPAQLRSEPRDGEQWAMAAAGSWVVGLDNVSTIPPWLSDALCKAVTGDGWIRRTLYTNSDVSVLSFRRIIGLTSIDAGALRGDLADRLLQVELEAIHEANRQPETEIMAAYERLKPRIIGALFDAVAAVLRQLPTVRRRGLPRMADFARVLAALDAVDGSDGRSLNIYLTQHNRLAADVIDGDPVAGAIVSLVTTRGEWVGTAGDLRTAISSEHPPRGWPSGAAAMGGRLKRLIPALKAVGIVVEKADRSIGRRAWVIRREGGGEPVQTVQTAREPTTAATNLDGLDGSDDLPASISANGHNNEVVEWSE